MTWAILIDNNEPFNIFVIFGTANCHLSSEFLQSILSSPPIYFKSKSAIFIILKIIRNESMKFIGNLTALVHKDFNKFVIQ